MTIPRLIMSHTVKGDATISVNGTLGANTITIPEGRYWTEPLLSGLTPVVGATDLLVQVAYRLGVYLSAVMDGTYVELARPSFYTGSIENTSTGSTFQFRGSNAATTVPGRAVLARIGARQLIDDTAALIWDTGWDLVLGTWAPDRGVGGDVDDFEDGFGVTLRSAGGAGFPYAFGVPLKRRVLSFTLTPAVLARRRGGASGYDYSFERCIKPYLMAGEYLRYYSDGSANNNTALSAAMTATTITASVFSGTGLANNEWVCINGEWAQIISGGGTTTLTLFRPNPVAHSIYDPVSDDFVGTYALDNDGGNIDMSSWRPERRSFSADFWDIVVPLVAVT